ncbi:hypothetical protein GCM10008927_25100 [Amylibacter ulvae]|uniref:DUF2796 domain-containing protein n=2 Tax=Paramylibacter ulvae TaxID=1651968 RepID=A0ABQ3D5B9_9RHOB|nr:hypothetical protein GCM10008927_25100 [Amylibacter ulvae]
MKLLPYIAFAVAAAPAFAEEKRQMDAHEHGVGQMNIAIEDSKVVIELHAPGADIVGFEYPAESIEDRTKIEAAVAMLAKPLDLFVFPAATGCSVVEATSELEGGEHHDHEDHDDEHGHDDHEHDEDHAHEEGHDENDEHDDHDEHASGHTEFHAEYELNCTNLDASGEIAFDYFKTFPNAKELEIQVISKDGATAVEVERDTPTLALKDLL